MMPGVPLYRRVRPGGRHTAGRICLRGRSLDRVVNAAARSASLHGCARKDAVRDDYVVSLERGVSFPSTDGHSDLLVNVNEPLATTTVSTAALVSLRSAITHMKMLAAVSGRCERVDKVLLWHYIVRRRELNSFATRICLNAFSMRAPCMYATNANLIAATTSTA